MEKRKRSIFAGIVVAVVVIAGAVCAFFKLKND